MPVEVPVTITGPSAVMRKTIIMRIILDKCNDQPDHSTLASHLLENGELFLPAQDPGSAGT